MPSGTVCFYNARAGFGVIRPDRGGPDVFVHSSAVAASGLAGLHPELRVRYVVLTDDRGQSCAHELMHE
ncbi:MAG TPA: cold shock domain-containing protein [Sphingomonas sp.]|nr:cold shock domain-containing protein [Sphingomonas sp.]